MGITMGDDSTLTAGRDVIAGNQVMHVQEAFSCARKQTDDREVLLVLAELQETVHDTDTANSRRLLERLVELAPSVAQIVSAALPAVLRTVL